MLFISGSPIIRGEEPLFFILLVCISVSGMHAETFP
jgi:hypothetical protein